MTNETPDTRDIMPGPDGTEMTLRQHVAQSTMCHPMWNELDHMDYLISEVGYEGEYARTRIEDIIQQMIITRSQMPR